jgi:hypothetical protein
MQTGSELMPRSDLVPLRRVIPFNTNLAVYEWKA